MLVLFATRAYAAPVLAPPPDPLVVPPVSRTDIDVMTTVPRETTLLSAPAVPVTPAPVISAPVALYSNDDGAASPGATIASEIAGPSPTVSPDRLPTVNEQPSDDLPISLAAPQSGASAAVAHSFALDSRTTPEPATLILVGGAAVVLLICRRPSKD